MTDNLVILRGGDFDRLRDSANEDSPDDALEPDLDDDVIDVEAEAPELEQPRAESPPEIEAQVARLAEAVNRQAPRGVLADPGGARQEARIKGYEGDACPDCGQFTLVRNGSCLKCESCGATTGCS